MTEHSVNLKVHWGDTDMAGIIYYPNYFNWFNIGSHTLFESIGIPLKELMFEDKIALPILDVGCSFHKPLYFGDEIKVVTKVTEVREKVFRMEHEVYKGNELTGKGHELRSWVQFSQEGNLKACTIPDDVRSKMMAVMPATSVERL
ncbi:acyl-CoA thioesterase [Mesobacillus jeotgali]|uniref:acyl-CoA thioesterase n=1 Tax=Mesobacillus jeotgali TaxID=129985 RepID=UPI000C84DD53|nr:thioesterase family protein [Mesobacillus jeotgali]